eukprot:10585450-Heterocapsa_arctica.AAC.1
MIKQDVKDDNNELRDYADDMVLFKEGDTEEEAISGLCKYLIEAKNKLTEIGQGRGYGIKAVQITKAE